MSETTAEVYGERTATVDEVRAERFVLVDGDGRRRAALGPADDGATGLLLYDAQERAKAQLVLDGSGAAHVKLHERDGDVAAWLAVARSGSPSLYLRGVSRHDRGVRGHAEVCVDEHGCPVLSLHDREGQARVLLSLDDRDGRPSLSFSDAQGNSRLVLSEDGSGGLLYLFDRAGEPRGDGVPHLPLAEPAPAAPEATPPPVAPMVAPAPAADPRRWPPGRAARARALATSPRDHRGGARRRGRRRARRPTAAAAGAAGESPLALATTAPAPAAPPIVASAGPRLEAEEFVLRDAAGGTRGRLGLLPDGAPYLQLAGADGAGLVQLAVLPGPDVVFQLTAGDSALLLSAAPDGAPSISLYEGDRVVFQAPAGVSRFPPPSVWP
ncbi:MAG: hypothetical protein KIT14_14700 [bacterium]|nr:hypothetical protein [bacterium]